MIPDLPSSPRAGRNVAARGGAWMVAFAATLWLYASMASAHDGQRTEAAPVAPDLAPPELSVAGEASRPVAPDIMVVRMAAEEQGDSLAGLNAAVTERLNATIERLKANEDIAVALHGIGTVPVQDRDGTPRGWRVRGELLLRSSDRKALAQVAGDLASGLQLAGVWFELSEGLRSATERALVEEAARDFGERALLAAQALGFGSYRIRSVNLGTGYGPRPVMQAAKLSDAALPTQAGPIEVNVTLHGTVWMQP
jgi:predicted secreted protein